MELIEKYQHLTDFSELENDVDLANLNYKSFFRYALFHTVTTPFQKFCANINYNLKDRNKMNDVEMFKKSINDENIFLEDYEFPKLIHHNKNFEIFKLIIDNFDNFDKFNIEDDDETFYYETDFTVEKINYIMQNENITNEIDIYNWFTNIIYNQKDKEIIECLIQHEPNIIFNIARRIITTTYEDDLKYLLNFIPDINEKYHNETLLESAVYFGAENINYIKILLDHGVDPFLIDDDIRITNKKNKYMIDLARNKIKPINRKLADDYECPVMYTKVDLYYLCSQSEMHAISNKGFTDTCPLCRHKMDLKIYKNE